MSAQTLWEAAARLREVARDTEVEPPLPWHSTRSLMGDGKTSADARYIALMSPDVALALADWLDDFADTALRWTDHNPGAVMAQTAPCLRLARLIIGDPDA